MPQTFYEVLCIFIIYAFIGWCAEVSYAALDLGIFVNRGFLNGPYCPIYGVGVLIVIELLLPLKNNLIILFIGSVILTSVLEYIVGYLLEKIFHNKWWDYSEIPFNINGYVCLKFSIFWGLSCSFIVLILHPIIFAFIHMIPKTVGIIILIVLLSAFTVDCIFTISTILKLNKRLVIIGEAAERLKQISDEIGENIYERTTDAVERKEYLHQNIEKKRVEYEKWSRRYKEILEEKIYGHSRLIQAFPRMKSRDYDESLHKLREHLKKAVKSKKEQEK